MMKIASLRLVYCFIWWEITIVDWEATTPKALHSILTSWPIIWRHIWAQTFAWGKSFFVLDWTIQSSLKIVIVKSHLWL